MSEDLQNQVRELRQELNSIKMDLALEVQRSTALEKKLDNLSTGIGRGLWILGGGFLTSITAWIAGGGLGK